MLGTVTRTARRDRPAGNLANASYRAIPYSQDVAHRYDDTFSPAVVTGVVMNSTVLVVATMILMFGLVYLLHRRVEQPVAALLKRALDRV